MRFTQKTSSETDGGRECSFSQPHSNAPPAVWRRSLQQEMPKSVLFSSDEHCLTCTCSFCPFTHQNTRGDVRAHVRLTSLPAGPERFCFSSRPRGAAPLMHNLMSEKCLYEQSESYLSRAQKPPPKGPDPPKPAQNGSDVPSEPGRF